MDQQRPSVRKMASRGRPVATTSGRGHPVQVDSRWCHRRWHGWLAWLLRKTAVSSVIFGARTVEQVAGNLAAADLKLSDEQVKLLDEASAFELGYPYEFMKNIQGRW